MTAANKLKEMFSEKYISSEIWSKHYLNLGVHNEVKNHLLDTQCHPRAASSGKNQHFSTKPSFLTSFPPITMENAKNEIYNNKLLFLLTD